VGTLTTLAIIASGISAAPPASGPASTRSVL
jgi:hypothetical protein